MLEARFTHFPAFSEAQDCGTCYELELDGSAHGGVRRGVVQVTNKGGMGTDGAKKAVFDLLVPGSRPLAQPKDQLKYPSPNPVPYPGACAEALVVRNRR